MEGIMRLHETIHDTKVRKSDRVILKLDFEKAYDTIIWDFLFKCMEDRGFDARWCNWIRAADTFAKMIRMAQQNNLLVGLVPDYIPKGVALQ